MWDQHIPIYFHRFPRGVVPPIAENITKEHEKQALGFGWRINGWWTSEWCLCQGSLRICLSVSKKFLSRCIQNISWP